MRRFRISKFEVRIFFMAFALCLLAAPLAADAQQPGRVYRVGFLAARSLSAPGTAGLWEAFVAGMREQGYIEGQNLVLERRFTDGREERAPALAAELVKYNVDLIVAHGTAQVHAAKQATSTIPIVMVGTIDPVGRGLVVSLARPGGNVTGLTATAGVEIAGKYVQVIKEAVPKASRVAILAYSGASPNSVYRRETETAARELNMSGQFFEVKRPEDFKGAFASITKGGGDVLVTLSHPFISTQTRQIVDLAAKHRLPAVYPLKSFVEAGGLLSYGHDQATTFRRIGGYANKILKGTNPADLPVEQPTKFDLIINLKTAKALGLTIPQTLLMRADEVIE